MTKIKLGFAVLLTLITLGASSSSVRADDFDEKHRFIFYAVLEGCYEDGLSTNDVAQILLKDQKGGYAHFVYACPTCTPTIHALEAYAGRPKHFSNLKTMRTTFGPGLTDKLKKQLYSEKPEEHLLAINTLMQGWVSRRIALLRLTEEEDAQLKLALKEMRDKGNSYLKSAEKSDPSFKTSAFKDLRQCAVCNGACAMDMKPEPGK